MLNISLVIYVLLKKKKNYLYFIWIHEIKLPVDMFESECLLLYRK
jgi:hypothetical protein